MNERNLLLRLLLELVGTEDGDTVVSLGFGETSLVTLEESEDILHDNVLDIDLVLVVQVGGSELDLGSTLVQLRQWVTYSAHVDLGV